MDDMHVISDPYQLYNVIIECVKFSAISNYYKGQGKFPSVSEYCKHIQFARALPSKGFLAVGILSSCFFIYLFICYSISLQKTDYHRTYSGCMIDCWTLSLRMPIKFYPEGL